MNFSIFAVAFLLCIGYPSISTETQQYVKVGCFKDGFPRALPELIKSYRGYLNWNDLQKVVKDCALEAEKKNYTYFGIQFYGECWSGMTAPLTYDRYGTSPNCLSYVGKKWTNAVYRLIGKEKECLEYSNFTSENRVSSYQLPSGATPLCDNALLHGWYRFLPLAGGQMATRPSAAGKCATSFTSWLSSKHPKTTDGIVGGKVCFRLDDEMCQWSQDIQVRNCGRFYVYKLPPTIGCPMRFCGQY